jgi:hypothetical protein
VFVASEVGWTQFLDVGKRVGGIVVWARSCWIGLIEEWLSWKAEVIMIMWSVSTSTASSCGLLSMLKVPVMVVFVMLMSVSGASAGAGSIISVPDITAKSHPTLGDTLMPNITAHCVSAASTYAENYQAFFGGSCANLFKSIISSSEDMYQCLVSGAGNYQSVSDCTSADAVMYWASVSGEEWLYGPYYLPQYASTCQFCNTTAAQNCTSLLNAVSAVAGGTGTAGELSVDGSDDVISWCSNYLDSAQLTGLRYQSALLCESSQTYGYEVTSVRNLNGVLDMRALLQCGKCSMIPCVYGQYCGKNSKAKMCPAGTIEEWIWAYCVTFWTCFCRKILSDTRSAARLSQGSLLSARIHCPNQLPLHCLRLLRRGRGA